MTSLAVLVSKDSRRVSAVYLAADSRISFETQRWDFGRKTFASRAFPDIYGYCGVVLPPSIFLGQFVGALDRGLVAPHHSTFKERFELMQKSLEETVGALPVKQLGGMETTIVCCGRDGDNTSSFSIGIVTIGKSKALDVLLTPVPSIRSQLLLEYGSGADSVRNCVTRWQSDDDQMTSRAAFSGFTDSVRSGSDPASGGAPQLVGIYNSFPAREFGLFVDGRPYFRGLPLHQPPGSDLEWRNEFFERTDERGQLLKGAARHEHEAPVRDSGR